MSRLHDAPRRLAVPLLVGMLATLGACADGAEAAPPPEAIWTGLSADALAWEPSSFTVQRDAPVTITAENSGVFGGHDLVVLSHVFATEAEATNAIAADPSLVVGRIGLLDPGESDSVTVTFSQPGTYQFICTVTGHFAGGMHGTITVEDQPSQSDETSATRGAP